MAEKKYINNQDLLNDSIKLALKIYKDGYRPNYIVAIWRGGTPIGISMQEVFEFLGVETDHISIRTSYYTGIEKQRNEVKVHGLGYIVKNINAEDSLLLVDDVFDSGMSVFSVKNKLQHYCRKNTPEIKIATLYYKPDCNKSFLLPDYWLHETDKWLVFPHELIGLNKDEIFKNKTDIDINILKELMDF